MTIYILIALLLFAGVVSKQGKRIYKIGLFCLFFISAFRAIELGGTDVYNYQSFYEEVPTIFHLSGFESRYTIGFTVLCAFIKSFSSSYLVFQFVYAGISIFLLNKVVKTLELGGDQECLFLFSYFCLRFIYFSWVAYRQNIANLLFWFFLAALYKEIGEDNNSGGCVPSGKWKKVFLIICILFIPPLFHSSAWANTVLLLIQFCLNKLGYNFKKLFVPVLSVVIYFIGTTVFPVLLDIMCTIDSRYLMYNGVITLRGNTIYYILRFAFLILFFMYYQSERYRLKNMFMDSLCLMVLLGSINMEIMSRIFEYYAVGLYGVMALCLNYFNSKCRRLAMIIYFAGFFIIFVRFLLITDNGLYFNYSFWFYN